MADQQKLIPAYGEGAEADAMNKAAAGQSKPPAPPSIETEGHDTTETDVAQNIADTKARAEG